MKQTWAFQHDNDLKHKVKFTLQWLRQNKEKVLEWPSQSLDLNNFSEISNMQFIHARQPKNIQDLEEFCQEGWTALTQEKNKEFNYHKKLQALIDAKGAILRSKGM